MNSMESSSARRQGLKVIQESAGKENLLVGNERPVIEKRKRKLSGSSSQRKKKTTSFAIFEDKSNAQHGRNPPSSTILKTPTEERVNIVETRIPVEAQLREGDLTADSPSADYWKILAETRRQALEKALEENERLYTEVGELKMKVEELEEERSKYEELAERAEYLADTLKFLTENDSEPNEPDTEDVEHDEKDDST